MSNSKIKGSELVASLNWRYAVKRFDPLKKLSSETWNALEEALRLTPSSYGLQPWKFIVVQNVELRKQLRVASWGQSQVEEASHFVVMSARKAMDESYLHKYAVRMSEVRGAPVESFDGFTKMVAKTFLEGPGAAKVPEWAARQCYIALGNLMTSAALLGVDACPMEGLDADKYDEILGLKNSDYKTIVSCALGYRHAEDKYQSTKKVRFLAQDVIEYK